MGISKKVIPGFVCFHKNIVKHIVNNTIGNVYCGINYVSKNDYCTHFPGIFNVDKYFIIENNF